ncbi:hypothetical protein GCM10022254_72390 [Actinomadura meridiana]|uniref:Peptidase S1 domain-containing protein n=1 Tax=Actinomadura meridiana TaxID=559626 RepID=A0ABP8CPP3_9ACTN
MTIRPTRLRGAVAVLAASWLVAAALAAPAAAVSPAVSPAVRAERIHEHVPERVAGPSAPVVLGGDPIYSSSGRCTLGFNLRKGDTYFFLSAGHCVKSATSWYADRELTQLLGHSSGSSFPGDDYGIVKYVSTPGDTRGGVRVGGEFHDITGAMSPTVGQQVTGLGGTSGATTGTVTALNVTVNNQEGAVTGLIRTTLCVQPGDSGAPVFAGSRAIGIIVGGTCSSGGTAYVQPIAEPLQAYGLEIY